MDIIDGSGPYEVAQGLPSVNFLLHAVPNDIL